MDKQIIHQTLNQGDGILRLIPVFIPRRFGTTGGRLHLHPDDYFALGTKRGSIKERWFSSVIPANAAPDAPEEEGLSFVVPANGELNNKFSLRDAVETLKSDLIGHELYDSYGTWPMF